jgi:predicted nucleic acid-binding protein
VRLFDTSFLVDLVNGQSGAVEKAKQVDRENDPAAVSVVTVHEYLLGVHLEYREPRRLAERLESARRDLTPFQVIPFTSEIAEESSRLQAWAQHNGRPIGINDLYVASTAVQLKLPLVTRNKHDFEKIPALTLENY